MIAEKLKNLGVLLNLTKICGSFLQIGLKNDPILSKKEESIAKINLIFRMRRMIALFQTKLFIISISAAMRS
jgi:hypothetical protein